MMRNRHSDKGSEKMSRLKFIGIVGSVIAALVSIFNRCGRQDTNAILNKENEGEVPTDKMTYRTNPKTKEKVSIIGFGCMRLPIRPNDNAKDKKEEIDQEMVNRLTDYALAHGVNYFDTSPVYSEGMSETSIGIALKRHPRNKYYIATKLSNMDPQMWSREKSIEMYNNSFKCLQTDHIDYMLLHAVGIGGMEALKGRYFDNGMLDFLLSEREKGKIRNLGFSYHGDIEVFDYLLANNDKYKWDFVQIQMNYMDWKHAKVSHVENTNAEYLYNELNKRGIPIIIMEPLLGGRLAKLPDSIVAKLKQREPEKSAASWAFRFDGTWPDVLTVLSGMTYMEHLQDNIRTYAPLKPLTDADKEFLENIAQLILKFPNVACTSCKYCMPCPYGIDIPSIFSHYNKCVNEGNVPDNSQDPNYRREREAFLIGYDRSVPKLRQASHCIGCNQCSPHCPQGIDIPKELHRIDRFVEELKQGKL